MPGTITGGKKAAAKNIEKYGPNYYVDMGRRGGRKGTTGGFASHEVGADGLTGVQRAVEAGARGGRISKRTKKLPEA